jgi:hypothetical protein
MDFATNKSQNNRGFTFNKQFGSLSTRQSVNNYYVSANIDDVVNRYLPANAQLPYSLSVDSSTLSEEQVTDQVNAVKKAFLNMDMPYANKTGASQYRYASIRPVGTSSGKLCIKVDRGSQRRVSVVATQQMLNLQIACDTRKKVLFNSLIDQNLMVNSSMLVIQRGIRTASAQNAQVEVLATSKTVVHSSWFEHESFNHEFGSSILNEENFTKENVVLILNLLQEIGINNQSVVKWSLSPLNEAVSLNSGNFVSIIAVNNAVQLPPQQLYDTEEAFQILPFMTVNNLSQGQTTAALVNCIKTYTDIECENQLPVNDMLETHVHCIAPSAFSELLLESFCFQDIPNQKLNNPNYKGKGKKGGMNQMPELDIKDLNRDKSVENGHNQTANPFANYSGDLNSLVTVYKQLVDHYGNLVKLNSYHGGNTIAQSFST